MAEKKKYNNTKTLLVTESGKLPPQATDIEEAVLGAVMLEQDALINVLEILKPESFYKDEHQKIFSAIRSLSLNQQAVDILTVKNELQKDGTLEEVGGAYYITQLTNRVSSSAHTQYHARIIAQKYIQRELIRVSSEIQTKSYDDSADVHDLLEFSGQEIFKISEGNIKKEMQHIDVIVKKALEEIEIASKREDGLSGVPSGFTGIDRVTSGWQLSDLVIIAARPSMGKTAFVLSMARNMAVDHNIGIAFFSLEMSSIQLVNRLIVGETELGTDKIKTGKLEQHEWAQLEARVQTLVEAPIYIDDTPAISLFELRSKCRRLKQQHDIKCIIIDYLQLMTAGTDMRGNREQEVSLISRSLKALAKELDVPILALSQLNRSVEMRSGDKRPQLSDLRESGAIEQDADIVCFIHRPEKYGITEDAQGNSTIGLAEIIIAKHRNGSVEDVTLRFRQEFVRFEDYIPDFSPDAANFNSQISTHSSKMNAEPVPGGMEPNNEFDSAPF